MLATERLSFGVVRLELVGAEVYEISLNMNPDQGYKGFGATAIMGCVDYVTERRPVKKFIAAVKKINTPSVRVVEKAGFTRFENLSNQDLLIRRGLDPQTEYYFERRCEKERCGVGSLV